MPHISTSSFPSLYLSQKHAKPKTHRGRATNMHDSESLWHCEMAMRVRFLLETTLNVATMTFGIRGPGPKSAHKSRTIWELKPHMPTLGEHVGEQP